ncbi:MAG: N-acetyltransferase family protein [Acidimicrobiales bacterium]|jgi:L-amino acid N-acyltransferase YncA
MEIRMATLDDAAPIADIYNLEVTTSVVTFDLVPRTVEEQRRWLRERSGALACLVALDHDGEIVGWASLSPYRTKPAYSTSVEDSIYIHRDHHGRGIGDILLGALVAKADEHGFHAIFARIVDGPAASKALHAKHGFEVVGIEREVGRKFGRWLDVTLMQRLAPRWDH